MIDKKWLILTGLISFGGGLVYPTYMSYYYGIEGFNMAVDVILIIAKICGGLILASVIGFLCWAIFKYKRRDRDRS